MRYFPLNTNSIKTLKSFSDKHGIGYKLTTGQHNQIYLTFTNDINISEFQLFPLKNFNIIIHDLNLNNDQKIDLFLNLDVELESYDGNHVLDLIEKDFSLSKKLKPIFSSLSDIDHIKLSKLIKNITHLKLFQPIFNRLNTKDLYAFAEEISKNQPSIMTHPDIHKIFSFYKDIDTSFSLVVHLSKKDISQFNNGKEINYFEHKLSNYFEHLKNAGLINDHIAVDHYDRKTKYLFVSKTFDFQNNKKEFLYMIKIFLENLEQLNKSNSYENICNVYAQYKIMKSIGSSVSEEPIKIKKL